MKILLANIPWYDEDRPDLWGVRAGSRWPHFQKRQSPGKLPRYIPFPFFLTISSTQLSSNHDVLLIDGVAEGITIDQLSSSAVNFSPDIIFAETSTPSFYYDMAVLQDLSDKLPGVKIICGGGHSPELAQDYLSDNQFPDYWIAGEYDAVLHLLVDCIANDSDTSKIPGVMTKDQKLSSYAKIDDLNRLPSPDFAQLPVKNYSDPVCGLPAPSVQSWLSRGCPFGCTFCVWPQIIYGNRKYRTRSTDSALDEIELLISEYGCESFYFDDDTTNIGEDRMKELSQKIISRGLNKYPWSMMARADCMSESMLESLVNAGLYSIKYGVESISPSLLNSCDKGTDINKLKNAINKTKEAGVKLHLTFTFGLPGETEATIEETLNYALKTDPETAQFSICTPFPGTRYYDECLNNGWLINNDWDNFIGSGNAVVATPELSSEKLMEYYSNALNRWNQHISARTENRKIKLIDELEKRVANGFVWNFSGDRDFADFLLNFTPLDESFCDEPLDEAICVIVSRHDEEKLYRRILREGKIASGNILRLYNM